MRDRPANLLRPITIQRRFTEAPAGSVLWQQGKTIVLCTASLTQELPPWFSEKRPGGWVTADYVMLPGSTPQRKPWPKAGHTDSRGTEIQRVIGRSLRAAIDLSKIGPHTIALDCQVIQADGGTRTAAICGAWVALADALSKLPAQMPGAVQRPDNRFSMGGDEPRWEKPAARYDASHYDPKGALVEQIAAVSVGVVEGEFRLDLDYQDDSRAEVDFNVAYTGSGTLVEVQGSAERGGGFSKDNMLKMLDLAVAGCSQLMREQRLALGQSR